MLTAAHRALSPPLQATLHSIRTKTSNATLCPKLNSTFATQSDSLESSGLFYAFCSVSNPQGHSWCLYLPTIPRPMASHHLHGDHTGCLSPRPVNQPPGLLLPVLLTPQPHPSPGLSPWTAVRAAGKSSPFTSPATHTHTHTPSPTSQGKGQD